MYRKILVPLDGSKLAEQVLPYARLLGKALGSQIELLRVGGPIPSTQLDAAASGATLEQATDSIRRKTQDYLERTATFLHDTGLEVSCSTLEGSPASHIVSEAEREPATLVAMTTHGRSGITRWVLGSITEKVLQATTTPLLVIRAQEQKDFTVEVNIKKVVVPLDGSPRAEQVLPHMMALAKALAAQVTLVRVTPSAAEYFQNVGDPSYTGYPMTHYADLAKKVDEGALNYLRRVSRDLHQNQLSSVEERLLHGPAADAIVDIARETPASIVSMTTHGRSRMGRWILGSVADRVVRHSGGPVLMIRATEENPTPSA